MLKTADLGAAPSSVAEDFRFAQAINQALLQLLNNQELEPALEAALQLICEGIGCDGVYMFDYTKVEPHQLTAHVFFGIRRVAGTWQRLPQHDIIFPLETPRVRDRFNEMLYEDHTTLHLNHENPERLRRVLEALEVASYMSFRMMMDGQLWGGMSLVSRVPSLDWAQGRREALLPFVVSLGNFIARKQLQEALKKQNDYLRKILDLNPNLIFAKDKNGRYTLANQAIAAGIYGVTPPEMLGKTDAELSRHAKEARQIMTVDQEVIQQGKSAFFPIGKVTDYQGEKHYLQTTLVPLVNEVGESEEIFGVSVDITDLKKTERQLIEEKRFSESIAYTIPDLVLLVDYENQCFKFHNITYPIVGFTEAEATDVFQLLQSRVHPEDVVAIHHFFQKITAAQANEIVEKHFRLQHKDGHWLHFYERAKVTSRYPDGRVRTYLAVVQDVTELKKAEKALQQSESILKATINALPDLKFRLNKEGIYLDFFESEYENIRPYVPSSAILGKRVEEVMPPPLTQVFMDNIQKALTNRQVQVQEYEIEITGKGTQYREARVSPINENEVIAVVRDITERKRTEEALQRSERRYRNFVNYSQEGIYYMNCGVPIPIDAGFEEMTRLFYENAFVEECNASFAKMYGARVEDLRGTKAIVFHGGEHYEENIQSFHDLVKKDFKVSNIETIEPDVHGNMRYFLNSAVGMVENGYLVGFWGTQVDITERKQAEEALQRSEVWASLIFDSTTDLMFLMAVESSDTFRCVRVNSAYCKLTGFTLEQLIGKTPHDVLQPSGAEFAIERYREAIRLQHSIHYEERALMSGRQIVVETSLTPIFNETGECTYLLGVSRDITERTHVQQRERTRTQVLEMLSNGATLPDIMLAIVQGVEASHESICSILLLDEQQKYFATVFAPNLPDFYNQAILQVPIGLGVGSCGTAAYTGERVIVADVQAHPYWTDFRELAQRADVRSCWSEPIKDSGGSVLGTFGIYHRTVTTPTEEQIALIRQAADLASIVLQKFQAEAVLKASQEQFASMVHNISDVITLIDANGIMQYQSHSIRQVLGFDEHELVGTNIFELLHPDDHAYIGQEFYKLLENGGTGPLVEFRFLNKAGIYVHLEGQGTNQLHNPAIKGIVVNSRDITARKAADHALQESRRILKAIVNALPDLKFRVTSDGLFLDYYESEYENEPPLLPPQHFIGKKIEEVLPSYVYDIAMQHIRRAITQRQVTSFEYYLPFQPESSYYEGRVSPISESEVIIAVRNISDRKKAQLALQEKVRELDEKNKQLTQYIESNFQLENFAYIASHDLREPVRTVHSFAQLLKKRYARHLDEDGQKCLDFIIYGSENMNRLIEDLLTYSRVSSEEHRVELLSIPVLLNDVTTGLARVISEKNATIYVHELPVQIEANPTTLRQLFQNLLVNAIKFHHPQHPPVIHISGISHGDHWLFEIKDNGMGIPQDMQDRIFQLFKKLHYVKEHQGTGMGLAICKRIAEQHQGEIWVESTPSQGSSFYFTIKKQQKVPVAEGWRDE